LPGALQPERIRIVAEYDADIEVNLTAASLIDKGLQIAA
jgi:hypothetical protein